MRNLNRLGDDPLSVYDALRGKDESPRGSRLLGLRDRIACAYLRYYVHQSALERVRPLGRRITEAEAKDLRGCYDGMTDNRRPAYARYYARILALSYYCAYCGVTEATTLDHYFPKDAKNRRRAYPEFSILPANLVPSCTRCNPSRDFRDEGGRRALIHPYFDDVHQERLLIADVTIKDGMPSVEFRVDLGQCTVREFGELYDRHVRLLDLLSRYCTRALAAEDGLFEIVRTVRVWAKGRSQADVAERIRDEARELERTLGANHFKVALRHGAAESKAFIDFCLEGTP